MPDNEQEGQAAQEAPQEPQEGLQEPQQQVQDPHPLDPGGRRFEAVYKEMQDARREAAATRERIAHLEGQLQQRQQPQPQQPSQPQKQFWSNQELQDLVDNNRISPAQMADQIAWQRNQQLKSEIRREVVWETRVRGAAAEVDAYIQKVPALVDPSSDEYRQLSRTMFEIADELGLDARDARVQRRALRETYGTLDKMASRKKASESERQAADSHAETGRGAPGPGSGKDPLAAVPSHYKEHWQKMGYSREQMLEEAKYIRPSKRLQTTYDGGAR